MKSLKQNRKRLCRIGSQWPIAGRDKRGAFALAESETALANKGGKKV